MTVIDLSGDQNSSGPLAAFDGLRAAYLDDVRATDPGAETVAPPAPWDGIYAPTDSVQRFELVHHIEEFARHAGHADIIRDQIDGATAASLLLAVQGCAGNEFVQPWTAPSGALTGVKNGAS